MIHQIRIIREPSNVTNTFGVMFINGYFECFTLENSYRIVNQGKYEIEFYNSPKNKMVVPQLKNVVNRENIQIHPANWYHELEGCIAVGTMMDKNRMWNSRVAFQKMMEKFKLDDKIFITLEW